MTTLPTSTPPSATQLSSQLTPPIVPGSEQEIPLIQPPGKPQHPEPVESAPEQLRMFDTNNDGKLTRREIRETMNKGVDALKAAPCDVSRAALQLIEQINPGATAALTQGTQKNIRQAETALATRTAAIANKVLPSEAASHMFAGGVEHLRPSDFAAAAQNIGQRLRECGLSEKDIPRHSSPFIEIAQNKPSRDR